jgi:hypothetical protein
MGSLEVSEGGKKKGDPTSMPAADSKIWDELEFIPNGTGAVMGVGFTPAHAK